MSDHASSMLRLGVSVILFITACVTAADLSSQLDGALELRSQQEEHSEGRIARTAGVGLPERIKGTQVMQAIRMNLQERGFRFMSTGQSMMRILNRLSLMCRPWMLLLYIPYTYSVMGMGT